MAEYTYKDMLRMQEEAANRVREMKKRAAIAVEDEPLAAERTAKKLPDPVKHISYPVELPESTDDSSEEIPEHEPIEEKTEKHSLLKMLTEDKDALLIMALLAVVSQDISDYPTAIALLYLLL